MTSLCGPQIVGRALTGLAVANDLVRDLLTFRQGGHAGTFDSGNMNENVSCAIIGLNEAKTLGAIEPLYGTSIHNDFLSIASVVGQYFVRFDRYLRGNLTEREAL
jgi:hypothetical protein